MVYTLQFDGACRGNPGLCGAGYVIYKDNEIIEQHSKFICVNNTNNFAEYSALLYGIQKVVELGIKNIMVKGDSQLVINQLNGIYRINSDNLLTIYEKIVENLSDLDTFTFQHIKRDRNKIADKLANVAITNYIENENVKNENVKNENIKIIK